MGGALGVVIREATEGDQAAIRVIIRAAQLNPLSLDWPRFMVAEDGPEIVGIGQVKPHSDGSRELASIAIIPSRQRQGLGRRIIRALLARETGPLYLVCMDHNDSYYQQFGFRRVDDAAALPPALRRIYRFGRAATAVAIRLARQQGRLIAMYRPAPPESTSIGP